LRKLTFLLIIALALASCDTDSPTEPVTLPNAPSELSATTVSWNSISLNWQDNSNNESYFLIERKPTLDSVGWADVAHVAGAVTLLDTGLAAQVSYSYRVAAYNSAGVSAFTTEAACSTGEAGVILWRKNFYFDEESETYGFAKCRDEGFVVLGRGYASVLGRDSLYVKRMDNMGMEVWSKGFDFDFDTDKPYDAAEAEDGSIYVVGDSDDGFSRTEGLVLKLTAAGDLVWHRNIGLANYYQQLSSIAILTDGSIIVGGTKMRTGSYDNNGWLMKVSAQGERVWEKTFPQSEEYWIHDIAALPDGAFVTAGLSLAKFNSAGTRLWAVGFVDELVLLTGVDVADNGNIAVSGWQIGSDSRQDNGFAALVDASGRTIWKRAIDRSGNEDQLTGIEVLRDGEIVAVGATDVPENGQDAWVVRLAADGTELWQTSFGQPVWADYFLGVESTSDGGFVACGGESRGGGMLIKFER